MHCLQHLPCQTSNSFLYMSSLLPMLEFACRLLSSFQYNLEEITIIAMPEDLEDEGQGKQGKAVQLHSFVDPAKGPIALNCALKT